MAALTQSTLNASSAQIAATVEIVATFRLYQTLLRTAVVPTAAPTRAPVLLIRPGTGSARHGAA